MGEISKVLFGILDSDDADYYNEKIKHLRKNRDDKHYEPATLYNKGIARNSDQYYPRHGIQKSETEAQLTY
jgi:hypothetical protein